MLLTDTEGPRLTRILGPCYMKFVLVGLYCDPLLMLKQVYHRLISGHVLACTQNHHLNFNSTHCTEVHFASLFSGGFTTMAVINPPEKKLAKRTSVRCLKTAHSFIIYFLSMIKLCQFCENHILLDSNYIQPQKSCFQRMWKIRVIAISVRPFLFYD